MVLTLLAGMLAMAVPLVWDWSHGTWDMQTQGHEPLILAISAWLVYRQREALAALQSPAAPRAGAALFVVALMAYICGRLLGVFRLELVSMMMLPAALLLYFRGFAALRLVWFAFF